MERLKIKAVYVTSMLIATSSRNDNVVSGLTTYAERYATIRSRIK
jgi:hypothetical protein